MPSCGYDDPLGAYSTRCAAALLGWEVQYAAKTRLCVQASRGRAGAALCAQPSWLQLTFALSTVGINLSCCTCLPCCFLAHHQPDRLSLQSQGGPAATGLSQVAPLMDARVVAAEGADNKWCTEPFRMAYAPYAVSGAFQPGVAINLTRSGAFCWGLYLAAASWPHGPMLSSCPLLSLCAVPALTLPCTTHPTPAGLWLWRSGGYILQHQRHLSQV